MKAKAESHPQTEENSKPSGYRAKTWEGRHLNDHSRTDPFETLISDISASLSIFPLIKWIPKSVAP